MSGAAICREKNGRGAHRNLEDMLRKCCPVLEVMDRLMGQGQTIIWWPEALNQFARKYKITPVDSGGILCEEIDTPRDYIRLLEELRIAVKA